jgi:phage terminase small subunit
VVASIDAGWLAPADAWLLSALVVVLDQVQRDAAKVSDQGSVVKGARSGELVRNPFAISLRQNLDALLRLSVRFGLSPRDRALLATLAMPEAPTGAASELFEQLMQQFRAASDQAVEAEEW